jgi:hypothetical protein
LKNVGKSPHWAGRQSENLEKFLSDFGTVWHDRVLFNPAEHCISLITQGMSSFVEGRAFTLGLPFSQGSSRHSNQSGRTLDVQGDLIMVGLSH